MCYQGLPPPHVWFSRKNLGSLDHQNRECRCLSNFESAPGNAAREGV